MEDITIGISSGAGGVLGVLSAFAYFAIRAKFNGRDKTCDVSVKLDALSADHSRQDIILGKLSDSRIETSTLLKQQVDAVKEQTALLRDRLPK